MKVAKFILGVILIIGAIVFMVYPFGAELVYAYVASIVAGVYGIFSIIEYIVNRKSDNKSASEVAVGGAVLLVSIVNIIFMLFNITIPGFTYAIQHITALFILVAILVEGIMTVISAFTYRNYGTGMRIAVVALGVLMIIGSIAGFAIVPVFIAMIGIIIGVALLLSGVNLILSVFSNKKTEI